MYAHKLIKGQSHARWAAARGTPFGIAARGMWIQLLIAFAASTAVLNSRAHADFVIVDFDYELKGTITIQPVIPTTVTKTSHFRPKSCMSLNPNMTLDPVTVPNTETINVPSGPPLTFNLYNVYPLVIDVPGTSVKTASIDIYDILAADTGSGIAALPDGLSLQQATFFGTVNNMGYVAQITPISDLANLPTSSANDSAITWDLSQFTGTTGNFYLSKVTVPLEDVAAVPEPQSGGLLLSGTLGMLVCAGVRHRRATRTRQATTVSVIG